jgi:hypothetical protein
MIASVGKGAIRDPRAGKPARVVQCCASRGGAG